MASLGLERSNDAPLEGRWTIARLDPTGARRVGSVVAGLVAALIGAAEVALGTSEAAVGSSLGLLGFPGVALAGWWLGPAVWKASLAGVVGLGVAMGLLAEPLGVAAFLVASVPALAGGPDALATLVVGVPMLFILGVMFAAFTLVITIPAGLVWAVGVRLSARTWSEP
jgi:hypothetical protein